MVETRKHVVHSIYVVIERPLTAITKPEISVIITAPRMFIPLLFIMYAVEYRYVTCPGRHWLTLNFRKASLYIFM